MPRSTHGEWQPAAGRPDVVDLLEQQAETRVPELVPIRYGRMMVSPATFFRGAAVVMASDLAATPLTGLDAQLCGDAHMLNFGGFASPERALVFDLNDFDETLQGSFELDLKRLVASVEINARERGVEHSPRRKMVRATVKAYREAMRGFAEMGSLEVWYARMDEDTLLGVLKAQRRHREAQAVEKAGARARRKDSTRAFEKLTQETEGVPRIKSDPPLVVPIHELVPDDEADRVEVLMRKLLEQYTSTLGGDRRRLLERFHYADLARKVVGVGSVGTRCWIVLLIGRDDEDPLFLQCKEAQPSVLAPLVGESPFPNQGQRVVEGQRMVQASSDIFLGWVHTADTLDGAERDFYIRQLWDWKVSAEPDEMEPDGMAIYGRMCGWTLARAHARSGDPVAIASYVGSGEALDKALAQFAVAYADQNEADHRELVKAVREKRVKAIKGV